MFNHLYQVSCPLARKRGAIGIFYPVSGSIPANTPKQAEQAFREDFETQGPPVRVELQANACANCEQWAYVTTNDCMNECRRKGLTS